MESLFHTEMCHEKIWPKNAPKLINSSSYGKKMGK